MATTAVRVFGKPITQGTRTQRAQVAKNAQNADGKLDQVLQALIQSQKAAAGRLAATVSTTFGRVYNATGDPVTYVGAHDWQGNVVGQYPVTIQNGQWAVFEHVGTRGSNRQGSVAAVVYNIEDCSDSMISWNNPWKTATSGNNTAYCEMNDPGYYNNRNCNCNRNCDRNCKCNCNLIWDAIYVKLMASGAKSEASMKGYATKVSIDEETDTPSYIAYFYLDD